MKAFSKFTKKISVGFASITACIIIYFLTKLVSFYVQTFYKRVILNFKCCQLLYTRGLRFCPIESCRCIDSRESAICLYIKIDMRLKFDGTESKAAGVLAFLMRLVFVLDFRKLISLNFERFILIYQYMPELCLYYE